jgi:hypothetical protein
VYAEPALTVSIIPIGAVAGSGVPASCAPDSITSVQPWLNAV